MADFTGLTGIWPAAIGVMSDASLSALRVIPLPQNGGVWTAGYLLSGQSATGTGLGMDSRPYSVGYMQANFSGNSASASLLGSYDSATWLAITSYYTGQYTANCRFSAQLNAYYPFLAARVDFVSASGGISAGVWMHVTRL